MGLVGGNLLAVVGLGDVLHVQGGNVLIRHGQRDGDIVTIVVGNIGDLDRNSRGLIRRGAVIELEFQRLAFNSGIAIQNSVGICRGSQGELTALHDQSRQIHRALGAEYGGAVGGRCAGVGGLGDGILHAGGGVLTALVRHGDAGGVGARVGGGAAQGGLALFVGNADITRRPISLRQRRFRRLTITVDFMQRLVDGHAAAVFIGAVVRMASGGDGRFIRVQRVPPAMLVPREV